MIKKRKKNDKIVIDLHGPQGNAFYLLSVAVQLSKELNKNSDEIIAKMKSSDYENLIKVFDEEFGDCCILYK